MAGDRGMSAASAPARSSMHLTARKESALQEWLPFVGGVLALFIVFTAMMWLIRSRADGSLIGNGDFAAGTNGWSWKGDLQPKVVAVEKGPVARALRLQVMTAPGQSTADIYLAQHSNRAIRKNAKVRIIFWACSPESLSMDAKFERAEDYTALGYQVLATTPTWQKYVVNGIADRDYAAKETLLTFHLGYGTGTFYIADVNATILKPEAP